MEKGEEWRGVVMFLVYFMYFEIFAGPDRILEFSPDCILSLYLRDHRGVRYAFPTILLWPYYLAHNTGTYGMLEGAVRDYIGVPL